MYTAIPYSYHDAHAYKADGIIWIEGELTEEEVAAIESKLDEGEFFIPADLNLDIAELQDQLTSFPSKADHVWHTLELSDLSEEDELEEGAVAIARDAFIQAFARIASNKAWDVEGASARIGLTAKPERP